MKTTIRIFTVVLGLITPMSILAQVTMTDLQGPVILMNGVAHLGNGEVIENSAIAFDNGLITLVGDARLIRLDLSKFEVIDAAGQHIYPGVILPVTTLGLEDTNEIRPSPNIHDDGFNPEIRSLEAYQIDTGVQATLRQHGILFAQPTPQGGVIAGASAVVMLDGGSSEDVSYLRDDGIHLYWPSNPYVADDSIDDPDQPYGKAVAEIDTFLMEAIAYAKTDQAVHNQKWEAMRGVLKGDQRLFIHADECDEITAALSLTRKWGIPNIVLVGVSDAHNCIQVIKMHQVPVIVKMTHQQSALQGGVEAQDDELPALLHKAGISVGLSCTHLESSQNLPFFAGRLAAQGIDEEETLRLVTSNTASIMGIDERTGTISEGKEANLVISEGNLLDLHTSYVTHTFIKGRKINQ